uniref:Phorbol-ester/DAG-type domain-containing protein n=1 Tax=Meloidogyne hapla TaxID=6305 RepID=A0A1I8BV29_MELHA
MEANCPRSTQQFRTFCQQQHEHLEPVIELMQNAGLPLDLQNYSLNHVSAIQIHINQTMGGEGHIRIVVFQKEQQYRIVFKGDGRAALFNICLLLENGHYNYIGKPEQLFHAHRFCVDCEKSVTRLYHWAGCSVVCRLCMRTGANFPCRIIERIQCNDCGFVFPQRACYEHHLINNVPEDIAGHQTRPFTSICQYRRICTLCGKIIFGQQQHDCIWVQQQQLQQQQQLNGELIECNKCHGPHLREQPCYIQPLRTVENSNPEMEQEEDISFESEAPVRQQHQQQNSTTKRIKAKITFTFMFF